VNSGNEMGFAELELIITINGRRYRLVEIVEIELECQHENKIDRSTFSLKSWECQDCGYKEEEIV
jgi:hypothetical protein